MVRRLFGTLSTIIIIILFCSCVQEPVFDENAAEVIREEDFPITRATSTEYETLANPYSLQVMQAVYDTYSDSGEILEPTDLYVKFMPKDSSELYTLMYEYDLELFDYPLDILLENGDIYVNSDIPDDDLTWAYTTVSPNFVFPEGISYEILEQCYIPEDGETVGIATKADSEVDVEEAAYTMLGYSISPSTRAKASPTGTIKVANSAGNYVPLKGVKIRCHNFVKWCTSYTNESGSYSMPKNYRTNVHYAIVFENSKGFDIWGNWGPIAMANHNMGWHSNSGYSENIPTSGNAWDWAVVNNSAYDYYEMCEANGIMKPSPNLKIWVFKDAEKSSAPMLGKLEQFLFLNSDCPYLNFFVNVYTMAPVMFAMMLNFVLPDITVGTNNKDYMEIYETVNHELAHASHFSQVGSEYWAMYVSYIITYGAYGDGTGNNAELCGIGEMWGYFMGCVLAHEKSYGKIGTSSVFPYNPIDGWIYPHILWDIYKKSILTKKQIYDCLTSDVDTYDELAAALYNKNTAKASEIRNIFISYGITPNVPLPWTGDNIVYDTNLVDMTYSSSSSVTGGHVRLQNVTVNSGAKLKVRGMYSLKIESPFVAYPGSQVELYYSI